MCCFRNSELVPGISPDDAFDPGIEVLFLDVDETILGHFPFNSFKFALSASLLDCVNYQFDYVYQQ
jgi:hypothetical protein